MGIKNRLRIGKDNDDNDLDNWTISANKSVKNTAADVFDNLNGQNKENDKTLYKLKEEISLWKFSMSEDMDEINSTFDNAVVGFEKDKELNTWSLYSSVFNKLLFLIAFIVTTILHKYPNNEIARKINRALKDKKSEDHSDNVDELMDLLNQLSQEDEASQMSKLQINLAQWLASKLDRIDQDKDYYTNKLTIQRGIISQLYKSTNEYTKKYIDRTPPRRYEIDIGQVAPSPETEYNGQPQITEKWIYEMALLELEEYKKTYASEGAMIEQKKNQLSGYIHEFITLLLAYVQQEEKILIKKLMQLKNHLENLNFTKATPSDTEAFIIKSHSLDTWIELAITLSNEISFFNLCTQEFTWKLSMLSAYTQTNDKPTIQKVLDLIESLISTSWAIITYYKQEKEKLLSESNEYELRLTRTTKANKFIRTIDSRSDSVEDRINKLKQMSQLIEWWESTELLRDVFLNNEDDYILQSLDDIFESKKQLDTLRTQWVHAENMVAFNNPDLDWKITEHFYTLLKSNWFSTNTNILKSLILLSKKDRINVSNQTGDDEEYRRRTMDELYRILKKNGVKDMKEIRSWKANRLEITSGYTGIGYKTEGLLIGPLTNRQTESMSDLQSREGDLNNLLIDLILDLLKRKVTGNIDLVQIGTGEIFFVDYWTRTKTRFDNMNDIKIFHKNVSDVEIVSLTSKKWQQLLEEYKLSKGLISTKFRDMLVKSPYMKGNLSLWSNAKD